MDIIRFGPGHRRLGGPPGTQNVEGAVIMSDERGVVSELAFGRYAMVVPHENPDNTALFIVISGAGWVQVGDERARVNHGEAVVWPPGVLHGAYTDGTEMRAIVVELAGGEPNLIEGVARSILRSGSDARDATDPQPPPTATKAQGGLAEREIKRDEYDVAEGEPLVELGVEPLTVEPLTPERFGDLAALFNEGGDPKWCYCMWFRKPNATWSSATPAENRADLEELASGALAPGLVAYREGEAVGWVSLAPREDFARLAKARVLAPVDDKPVWSIVCFVVSKRARGTGVAVALLDAAVAYAKAHGATTLEAYPVAAERGHVPSAAAFHGTQAMFERAGFAVVEVRRSSAKSEPKPIMRLEL